MRYWHISISSVTRLPLFPSEARRRAAVRTIVHVCAEFIVLFSVVDDHVHVIVVCTEERLGRVRAALWNALRPLAACPLAAPHVKPVETRRHLERLVRYFLTQTDHHGLAEELPLYSGSCYLDLIGARVVSGWETRLFRALPRWRVADLHRIVGLSGPPLEPADDDRIRAAGASRLAFAAAMSTAADPELRGTRAAVVAAREVTVRVASAAGIPPSEVCWALGITSRGLRKIEGRPVAPESSRAARLSVGLIDRVYPEAAALRLRIAG